MTDYPQYPADPSQPSGPPPPGQPQGSRPKSVELAVKLIWTIIALGLVSAVLTFLSLDEIVDRTLENAPTATEADPDLIRTGAIIGSVLGLVIGVGIYALLAVFIGKGANWARITFTVLSGLGILISVFSYATGGVAAQPVPLAVIGLVSLLLTVTALVLLWRGESRPWFSRPRFPQG